MSTHAIARAATHDRTSADDTIRRAVRGWLGAWGITRDELAEGIGMVPRTFYRRLNATGRRQQFAAGEVADLKETS